MSLIGSSTHKAQICFTIKQSINSDKTIAKTHYLTSGYTFLSALDEGSSYKKNYFNIRGNYNVLTECQEKGIFRESNVSTVFQTPILQ